MLYLLSIKNLEIEIKDSYNYLLLSNLIKEMKRKIEIIDEEIIIIKYTINNKLLYY
jgi:hypothetical protein